MGLRGSFFRVDGLGVASLQGLKGLQDLGV